MFRPAPPPPAISLMGPALVGSTASVSHIANAHSSPHIPSSRYRTQRGKTISIHNAPNENESRPTSEERTDSRQHSVPLAIPRSAHPPAQDPVSMSMSRYRRRSISISPINTDASPSIGSTSASAVHEALPGSAPVPVVPVLPIPTIERRDYVIQYEDDNAGRGSQYSPSAPPMRQADTTQASWSLLRPRMAEAQSRPGTSAGEQGRQWWRRDDEQDGRGRGRSETRAFAMHDELSRSTTETDRPSAEQKKTDLDGLYVQLAGHQHGPKSSKSRSPIIEKFSQLTKRAKSREGRSPGLSPSSSSAASFDFNSNNSRTTLPDVPRMPAGIQMGGKGIVPQTDAPVSAVNHGDRIVNVRYRQHTFTCPVTLNITAVDILTETAKRMPQESGLGPETCVVRECYGPLGLERRIRRYESIRDVMNTWDRDTHNVLVVSLSETTDNDRDLTSDHVAEADGPPASQLHMYHANKPGRWNKRWIRLLDNGQIISSKKENSSAGEKDVVILCHLSDYDVYTPTESQMRRNLKPPKRHCFAVKSQYKPAVFMNADNYVQYFCTEDARTAAEFFTSLHTWRSRYLYDRRPETPPPIVTRKTDDKPPQLVTVKQPPKKSAQVAALGGHRLKVSVDESPYAIGEFEPLLDLTRFDKRLSQFGKDFLPPTLPDSSTMPKPHQSSGPSGRERDGTRPDVPALLIATTKPNQEDTFTSTGLLGQAYEDRQAQAHAQARNEKNAAHEAHNHSSPFTDGPSLLNRQDRGSPQPSNGRVAAADGSWLPSAVEHTAKHRDLASSASDEARPTASGGPGGRSLSRQPTERQRSQSQRRAERPNGPLLRVRPEMPPNPLSSHHPNSTPGSPAFGGRAADREQQQQQQRDRDRKAAPPPLAHHAPKPLVNLTPPSTEPPQWAPKRSHGVQAPEGVMHLIDMISVGGSGSLQPPVRSATIRRPNANNNRAPAPAPGGGGLSRTRSKSSVDPASRSFGHDAPPPPMPVLPPRGMGSNSVGPKRGQQVLQQQQQQQQQHHHDLPEYKSVPGRTGTLRVV